MKSARNRQTQAVMSLRGKPLSPIKNDISKILANEEYRNIIHALGCGIDKEFNIDKLRYHKIIILADADKLTMSL